MQNLISVLRAAADFVVVLDRHRFGAFILVLVIALAVAAMATAKA
jgi:hypothetical protein